MKNLQLILIFVISTFLCLYTFPGFAATAKYVPEHVFFAIEHKYCPSCDLSGVILQNPNFEGADLHGTNFRGAQLHQANFDRAILNFGDFRNAQLNGATFSRASLVGANLSGANLNHSNLSGANLQGAKNFRPNRTMTFCRTVLPNKRIINNDCPPGMR